MSEDTDIIERKPLLKAAIDYAAKRVVAGVALAVTAGTLSLWQKHETHNQIWDETGNHFQDLVKQVQELQREVDELKGKK